jgi:hypothetical protein
MEAKLIWLILVECWNTSNNLQMRDQQRLSQPWHICENSTWTFPNEFMTIVLKLEIKHGVTELHCNLPVLYLQHWYHRMAHGGRRFQSSPNKLKLHQSRQVRPMEEPLRCLRKKCMQLIVRHQIWGRPLFHSLCLKPHLCPHGSRMKLRNRAFSRWSSFFFWENQSMVLTCNGNPSKTRRRRLGNFSPDQLQMMGLESRSSHICGQRASDWISRPRAFRMSTRLASLKSSK